MASWFPGSTLRAAPLLPLVLALIVVGCQPDGYPDDLAYPPRTDPLILENPKTPPQRLDPPGALDRLPQFLEDNKGVLIHFNKIEEKKRRRVDRELKTLFGTPSEPTVVGWTAESKLGPKTLARGSLLYRRHCLHCHGLVGDGHGPTAPWVNPHPRDYRLGQFKFTSSAQAAGVRKPLRSDLLRTLRQGVEGTSMPSFALLPEKELEDLTSFVVHLSLRGQTEVDVLRRLTEPDADEVDVKEAVEESLDKHLAEWLDADRKAVSVGEPPAYLSKSLDSLSADERKQREAAVRRGRDEFLVGTAKCVQCHNDFGRANDYRYDSWGTIVRPANLTAGVYRGGGRPLDLYYRIQSGVAPSGMPEHGFLSNEKTWDVVAFIQSLPYPRMLPEDVREQVYKK